MPDVSEKRGRGRPSLMTEEVVEDICDWLAAGNSLRSLCLERAEDKSFPEYSSVMRWIVSDSNFYNRYVQARQAAGFAHADGIVDETRMVALGVHDPQTGRAIMDGLKWAAERMAPKQHSPRQEVSGPGGDPVQVEHSGNEVIDALRRKHGAE